MFLLKLFLFLREYPLNENIWARPERKINKNDFFVLILLRYTIFKTLLNNLPLENDNN